MSEIKSGIPVPFEKPKPQNEFTPQAGIFRQAERWPEVPHEELVGSIRNYVARAKEGWEERNGKGTFDPAQYLGEMLTNKAISKGFGLSPDEEKEKALRMSNAWDAITAPYQGSKEYKQILHGILRDAAHQHGRFVSLEPKGMQLIEAMAEAINIPHPKGKTKIDLLQHVPKDMWPEDAQNQPRRLLTHVKRLLSPDKGEKLEQRNSLLSIIAEVFKAMQEKPPKND